MAWLACMGWTGASRAGGTPAKSQTWPCRFPQSESVLLLCCGMLALTNVCYSERRPSDNGLIHYIGAIKYNNAVYCVGDAVQYGSNDQKQQKGQIIAIYQQILQSTLPQFYAVVRQLKTYKQLGTVKVQLKQVNPDYPTTVALYETNVIETLLVQNLQQIISVRSVSEPRYYGDFVMPRYTEEIQEIPNWRQYWPQRALEISWNRHLGEKVSKSYQQNLSSLLESLEDGVVQEDDENRGENSIKGTNKRKEKMLKEVTKKKAKRARTTTTSPQPQSKQSSPTILDITVPSPVYHIHSCQFFTHLELRSPLYQGTIHVGMTLAIATATRPVQPYQWSPAQVVAILQKKSDIELQVRWFSHLSEIPPALLRTVNYKQSQNKKREAVVEIDEHLSLVPLEAVLGQVHITSNQTNRKHQGKNSRNHWFATLQCQYLHVTQFDEESLRLIDDWAVPLTLLQGPLSRGFLCDKTFPGKHYGLRQRYKAYLKQEWGIQGDFDENIHSNLSDQVATKVPFSWPKDLLKMDATVDKSAVLLRVDLGPKTREFFQSVMVPVIRRRCDPTATKAPAYETLWSVQVGDIVCLAKDKATMTRIPGVLSSNVCFPFIGPWSVCQVLSIYRDTSKRNAPSSPQLEVRWFYRQSDLPEHMNQWIPPYADTAHMEIFETTIVESEVPISRVLGRVAIWLAHHTEHSNPVQRRTDDFVPTVGCRCRFLYIDTVQRIQPLFCADATPGRWFPWLVQRGLKTSHLVQAHKGLEAAIEFNMQISVGRNSDGLADMFSGLLDYAAEAEKDKLQGKVLFSRNIDEQSKVTFFLSAVIDPLWTAYQDAEFVCALQHRQGLRWRVRVGDVVAVRQADDKKTDPELLHPFNVSWRPAQVLAIMKLGDGWSAEVRWLSRRSQSSVTDGAQRPARSLDVLFETDDLCTVRLSELLAPIVVLRDETCRSGWRVLPTFLPALAMFYGGEKVSSNVLERDKSFKSIIGRGVQMSNLYSNSEREQVMSDLRETLMDASPQMGLDQLIADHVVDGGGHPDWNADTTHDAKSTVGSSIQTRFSDSSEHRSVRLDRLFHTDLATGNMFFEEITIQAGADVFQTAYGVETPETIAWKVRLGDTVAVHYDTPGGRKRKLTDCFPFKVPWGIAEVVTIVGRKVDGKVESMIPASIRLEIRWFYRINEVSGSKRKQEVDVAMDSGMEEILESDHIDEVSPASLLVPAILHDSPPSAPCRRPQQNSVAAVEFVCRSFWSQTRKSQLPWGGLAERVHRGRSYSAYFGRNSVLGSKLSSSESVHSANPKALDLGDRPQTPCPCSPEEAFKRVIDKLSLTDASKEAYENGLTLIGREQERDEIKKFLQSAISGDVEDGKPSMFVGGPPGVGKTASVRAVISDMQRHQAAGVVSKFKFIQLNGMEMRHPYEAYTKLWEEVSGERIITSAETAALKLEEYFTSAEMTSMDQCDATVLLVDEIDYLVTKKESVLYNLFDWPTRVEKGTKRRLIVIGVSNTLNLPERLHPRVQSRIGSRRCYFKSYNVKETVAILEAKTKLASPNYDVFDKDAILYAAKKTATLSGDIRKAFRICRAAAEMILTEIEQGRNSRETPKVLINDVLKVSRESFDSSQARRMTLSTPFEALFIVAVATLSKTTGREHGNFDVEEIMTKMEAIANSLGDPLYLPSPSLSEALGIMQRLGEAGIISLRTPRNASFSFRSSLAGSGGAWPLVSTELEDTAIFIALKGTDYKALANKYLVNSGFVLS